MPRGPQWTEQPFDGERIAAPLPAEVEEHIRELLSDRTPAEVEEMIQTCRSAAHAYQIFEHLNRDGVEPGYDRKRRAAERVQKEADQLASRLDGYTGGAYPYIRATLAESGWRGIDDKLRQLRADLEALAVACSSASDALTRAERNNVRPRKPHDVVADSIAFDFQRVLGERPKDYVAGPYYRLLALVLEVCTGKEMDEENIRTIGRRALRGL